MLGRFLFRWRGVIGFVAFGVVFWLARPAFGSCLIGLPFVVLGLAVRFWASGYIGIEGRVKEIGGQREERGVRREEKGTPRRRIVTGPYRTLRHPLYVGNFLLVVGMLVALRLAAWLAVVVLAGFIAEYALIVAAEERDFAERRSQRLEARSESAEVEWERDQEIEGSRDRVADSRSKAESPMSKDGKHGTVPVLHQRPESFLLSRALVEWRTWVVTGVAWGLALVKALLVRS